MHYKSSCQDQRDRKKSLRHYICSTRGVAKIREHELQGEAVHLQCKSNCQDRGDQKHSMREYTCSAKAVAKIMETCMKERTCGTEAGAKTLVADAGSVAAIQTRPIPPGWYLGIRS